MNPFFSRFIKYPNTRLVLKKSFHSSLYNFGIVKPFLLADIGEGITECEIVQWFVKPGETVAEFDKICEVQSDKASVEISSRYAGNILKIYYGPNEVAKVGFPLVDIETNEEEEDISVSDGSKKVQQDNYTTTNYISGWETPAVRRLLNEYGLNVKDIIGSGKKGRVLKGDVLSMIKSDSLEKKVHIIKTTTITDDNTTVPLNTIQKAMFKTMTKSLSIPQLGYKDEIELNATSEYKDALNAYISNSKPDAYPFKKISYLPIFIKCLSLSLSFFPIINAQLQQKGGGFPQLIYRDAHHIGIAMDTPQGLIVPNIKNIEKKTIFEIAGEIHRLTQLAKKGTMPLSDLKGGTITLSNIGSIGGTYANPIIASSELAIVALGSARNLPRLCQESNALVAKQIMPVSWSADHRIIDGATMAQFSNTWKSFIENPALLASQLH